VREKPVTERKTSDEKPVTDRTYTHRYERDEGVSEGVSGVSGVSREFGSSGVSGVSGVSGQTK
jgi:hypothetical protein